MNITRYLALAVLALALPVGAQVFECTYILRDLTGEQPVDYRGTLWFSRDVVHLDTAALNGYPSRLIYDASGQRLRLLDDERRIFYDWDEQYFVSLHENVSAARRWSEALRGRSRRRYPEAHELTLRALDRYRELGGLRSRQVQVLDGNRVLMDLWGAPFAAANLPPEAYHALAQLASRYDLLASGARAAGWAETLPVLHLALLAELPLFPMLLYAYEGDRVDYQVGLSPPRPAERTALATRPPPEYRRRHRIPGRESTR